MGFGVKKHRSEIAQVDLLVAKEASKKRWTSRKRT
jgi:hypothetical protein